MIQKTEPPKEPSTLAEFIWYCKRYEKGIFVRVKEENDFGDVKWGSKSLAELTPQQYGETLAGFIEKGIMPIRVLEEGEIPFGA